MAEQQMSTDVSNTGASPADSSAAADAAGERPSAESNPARSGSQRFPAPRKGLVVLGSSALLATALLAGCSDSKAELDAVGVCVDKSTQKRLPDSECDHSSHSGTYHPSWVYYGMGRTVPAVGSKASGYSTSTPSGYYTQGGFSAQGGASSEYKSLVNGSQDVIGGSGTSGNGKKAGTIRGGFGSKGGSHGG